MDNPFQFDNGDFDRELVKSINSKIPTKVMAYPKDGRSPYLTTVYKNPYKDIEDSNNLETLSNNMKDYLIKFPKDLVDDMDLETVKEACKAIVEVKDDFPQIKLTQVMLDKFYDSRTNIMKTTYDYNILFNLKYFAKDSQLRNKINVRELMYHEMGHVIMRYLCKGDIDKWNNHEIAREIINMAKQSLLDDNLITKENIDNLPWTISSYAADNSAECMAEAIRDYYIHKDKAKIFSKRIYQIIKEKFK